MRWLLFRRRPPRAAAAPDAPVSPDAAHEATLVQDAVPGLPRPPLARRHPSDPGDAPALGHVGRYALKSVLGEGGLGTVYAAWDPLLSRPVAVKMLRPVDLLVDTPAAGLDMPRDDLILHEARAAARLSHPHIVTIHDAGRDQQGIYIAMEPLRGRDLRHLLREGWRPGPLDVAHLARHVAEALDYAHGKGVIHCDVKPANIFMVGRKQPKLLDFGIARVSLGDAARGPSGPLAGSPYYLAPEQLRGDPVDRRCDVYALGVVMYELLTGTRPYLGADVEAIAHAVLHQAQPLAHQQRRGVPQGLSAVVARAMAREPMDRHRSARHLAQQLRHWLDSDEASLLAQDSRRPAGTGQPGTPWPLRGPRAVLAAGVRRLALPRLVGWLPVLLAVAVGLGAIGLGTWRLKADHAPGLAPSAPTTLALRTDWQPPDPNAAMPSGRATATAEAGSAPTVEGPVDSVDRSPDAVQASRSQPPADRPADRPSERPSDRPARTSPGPRAPRPAAAPATGAQRQAVSGSGTVQLAISPWGQVRVDGRDMGVTPPLTELQLPEGSHTITVHNGDLPVYSQRVQVWADQRVQVHHRFQP